jgi:hypothetical protein
MNYETIFQLSLFKELHCLQIHTYLSRFRLFLLQYISFFIFTFTYMGEIISLDNFIKIQELWLHLKLNLKQILIPMNLFTWRQRRRVKHDPPESDVTFPDDVHHFVDAVDHLLLNHRSFFQQFCGLW